MPNRRANSPISLLRFALAAALLAAAGCGQGSDRLPRLGVEIGNACVSLPAEIEVAASGGAGDERWILAAPYRSAAAYAALGIEIESASLARLVEHGNTGPECLLVARLVDGRLVEWGHPPAACAQGIHLGGELSAEPGVWALRAGDRLRLEAMPGGRVAILRTAQP